MIDVSDGRSGDPAVREAPIVSVYQPIVDLTSGDVVAFEALARWPSAPHLEPDTVFGEARLNGTLSDLDREAQIAALRGAHDAALPESYALFINVEVGLAVETSLAKTISDAAARLGPRRVVIELTERALLVDPARVIEIIDAARDLGVGIALDDVGSNPDSLTMLEFVAPDIIKIDGDLIRTRHLNPIQSAAIHTIAAHIEICPDTYVVAEGIETADDLEQALSLGATHGQGWFLGRPAPLPRDLEDLADGAVAFNSERAVPINDHGRPSTILDRVPTRVARKSLLRSLTRHLEDTACSLGEPVTVISTFQHAQNFSPQIAKRYSALGASNPNSYIGALAIGLPSEPAPYVHGTAIAADESVADDWIITVVGPNFFAALIARCTDATDTSDDPTFTYILTHDRKIVTDAARSLMRRMHIKRPPETTA